MTSGQRSGFDPTTLEHGMPDMTDNPRRFPTMSVLTIAISLLTTTVAGVWFAGQTFSRIMDQDRRIINLESGAHEVEVSRDQRWTVVTASLSALHQETAALHAVVESLRMATERLQNIQDRAYRNPK